MLPKRPFANLMRRVLLQRQGEHNGVTEAAPLMNPFSVILCMYWPADLPGQPVCYPAIGRLK